MFSVSSVVLYLVVASRAVAPHVVAMCSAFLNDRTLLLELVSLLARAIITSTIFLAPPLFLNFLPFLLSSTQCAARGPLLGGGHLADVFVTTLSMLLCSLSFLLEFNPTLKGRNSYKNCVHLSRPGPWNCYCEWPGVV